ncbi:MAG: DUF4199 domain-containing protein [Bacteroidales bacterium]|nr:DUF4199 domain-containing protein [Bacteroidales bacterium]
MEEKVSTQARLDVQYGLVLALSSIIYIIILYFLGLMFEPWVQYPNYIIIGAIIYLGQKKLAESKGDLGLSYGKALGFGVIVSIISAVIVAVFNYLFYEIIAPEAIQQTIDFAEQTLIEKGLPDDQIEMALEIQKKIMTPLWLTLLGFFGQIIIGLVISLLTSIFTRKEEII